MSYVTQGTVQIELNAGTGANDKNEITVTINPAQDYTVRHNSKTFIVFIADESKDQKMEAGTGEPKGQPFRTIAFEKTQSFIITSENSKNPESSLVRSLVDAALKQIKIEVKIQPPNVIESVKIPATPSVTNT